jgi:NodT family efflux transporter outer membrane factor (OMF) lipoprotein
MTHRFLSALPLAALALLGACTVGPDFERPKPPSATAYVAPAETETAAGQPAVLAGQGPALQWWTAFGSPQLDALVAKAIANNQSLVASNATLAKAAQELRAIRGTQLPQIDANARVEQQQVNIAALGFSGFGPNPEFALYTVGGGVSYDLDLFGARRRQVEQTAARAEAQLRQTEAAHLTLAGQVVNQVLLIAATRAQIDAVNALLAEDDKNVSLTDKRRRAGEGTLVQVLNAQSQATADRADLPELNQQLAEAKHMLAVLVGETPAEAQIPDFDLDHLTLPTQIPVSLPSELVHRRPDILQAEADFHAATAAIGVATAHLYPNITLGATIAQAASHPEDVFSGAFRGYDAFAGLTAPIFHGGTLKAEQRAAVEDAKAAQATYQQTVLTAFGQVADLLTAMTHDQQALADQRAAVDVAGRSLALSRRSFEVGNSGVIDVLDQQRVYQRALQGLVQARSRQYLNVARLYVATAGGWTGDPAMAAEHAAATTSGS